MNSRFSNFVAFIPFRWKCRRITLELISWRLHFSLERERTIRRRLFTSSIKREIRYIHVIVVQWQQINVQKKCDALAKLLFCLFNPLLFLTFSLPSPLLKLSSLRWRRQRERQKSEKFKKQTTTLRTIHVHLSTITTWNDYIVSFISVWAVER